MSKTTGQELTANLVLRRERSLHGRNVENNLESDGESILESPEVHDGHIEATGGALDGAVTSSDDRDTVPMKIGCWFRFMKLNIERSTEIVTSG